MQISIIIVTHNRPELLKRCLDSVAREFNNQCQIIVALNGPDQVSLSWLKEQSHLDFFEIERTTPSEARNLALKRSKGDWIAFFDDDIELPNGYFEQFLCLVKEREFDVLGGPDATASDASKWEVAIGRALTSPLSTSQTRWRHSQSDFVKENVDESALILCNLWIKKAVLEKNPFPKNYWRNEENVMLHKLSLSGARFAWSSKLFVYHKRKNGPIALYRAVSSSGQHRLRSFQEYPESLHWRFFMPAFFLLYLVSLPLTLLFCPLMLIPALTYLCLNLSTSIYYGKSHWLRVAYIQLLINISYGIGMWRELIRFSPQ